jgi:hypothetical protein
MINQYDSQSGFYAAPNETPKKTPFYEIIKTLTPTLLIIFGYLGKMSRPIFYGFAFLAVIGIYYDPISKRLGAMRDRFHNRTVVNNHIKQLRLLAEELATFLDISVNRNDRLQAIVDSINQRNFELTKNLRLPAPDIFHAQGYYLGMRIHYEHLNVRQFHAVFTEFYALISGYSSYAVCPVFRTLAQENLLNAYEKSQLNAFQQRWNAYIADYVKFAKQLNRDLHSVPAFSIGIGVPLPIS